jgi:hypothetical protein
MMDAIRTHLAAGKSIVWALGDFIPPREQQ